MFSFRSTESEKNLSNEQLLGLNESIVLFVCGHIYRLVHCLQTHKSAISSLTHYEMRFVPGSYYKLYL